MYILEETEIDGQIRREFVCDNLKELKEIDNSNFGDFAIIINPASIYLKNSHNKWIEL